MSSSPEKPWSEDPNAPQISYGEYFYKNELVGSFVGMSSSPEKPWSENPNAPKIPYEVYFYEKTTFAGNFVAVMFYGTETLVSTFTLTFPNQSTIPGVTFILFFRCMEALINPTDRTKRQRMRWILVAKTMAMFSILSIDILMNINDGIICYIDNRGFPGTEGPPSLPPGPLAYQLLITSKAIGVVPLSMFPLNQWLADGLFVSFVSN
jgi:hypothetical protein